MTTRNDIHRTTVDIELEPFRRAQELLGTSGYRDTINQALREVDRIAALRRGAELIRRGELNVVRPEDLPELRKIRSR